MIGKLLMKQHYLKEEEFYSNLNMEEIADYIHGKRVCKDLELKNLREYHNLCLESHTLLLADVFENFRKLCWKNYQLDPANFFSAHGLAWQADLKKTKVKLELLTDIDLLLMVEKGTRGEYVRQFTDMQKLIINIWKITIKKRNHYILDIGM